MSEFKAGDTVRLPDAVMDNSTTFGPGYHAPLNLWVKGPFDVFPAPEQCVAIIGSRAATAYGMSVASDLAERAVRAGFVVVSGLAFGIDSAAHRGALATGEKGVTIAALPSGLDRIYPASHVGLADEIGSDYRGWVVSEYDRGVTPTRERFLERNELMSRLARKVVVVEAGPRSGAMHMARVSLERGCLVGAVPGPVTSVHSTGTNDLIASRKAELVTPENFDRFLTRTTWQ